MKTITPERAPPTDPPCYLAGTRLATPDGAVRVEDLAVGALVLTAGGDARGVSWTGHRVFDCAKYRDPAKVWPICIQAHAFDANVPERDLWVSPGHSIFVDGMLIPAGYLVNAATIVQVPRGRVDYWHVEIDRHDILLAEGLAAESYLDTGNRAAFLEGGAFLNTDPDVEPKPGDSNFCAPMVTAGPELQAVKARLLERAVGLGYQMTDDSDAHLLVDGQRLEPLFLTPSRLSFWVPAGRAHIELRCRPFVPSQVIADSGDARALGLCVGRLQLDGSDLPLDHAGLTDGWHDWELNPEGSGHRWTRERLVLPAGTRLIVIDLATRSFCWNPPQPGTVIRAHA